MHTIDMSALTGHSEGLVLIIIISLIVTVSSQNESIATSVHGTHHIPKHYKENNLFNSFHCRLFIRMIYNGGRKTGDATLQTW